MDNEFLHTEESPTPLSRHSQDSQDSQRRMQPQNTLQLFVTASRWLSHINTLKAASTSVFL